MIGAIKASTNQKERWKVMPYPQKADLSWDNYKSQENHSKALKNQTSNVQASGQNKEMCLKDNSNQLEQGQRGIIK